MSYYRNSEGYYDPTAGEAFARIIKAERIERRKRRYRPLVYICSRYAGDIAANTLAAKRYCRFAVDNNCIPFAAHLLYPQFMDDSDRTERNLGLFFGNVLMDKCDEVWIFSDGDYSEGMQAEYDRAERKGFKIRYFTADCRETECPLQGKNHGNGGAYGCV